MLRCKFSFALPRMDLTLHAAPALTQEDGNCKGYQTRLNHILPNKYSKRAYSPLQLHQRGGKKRVQTFALPLLDWNGSQTSASKSRQGERPSAERRKAQERTRFETFFVLQPTDDSACCHPADTPTPDGFRHVLGA